MPTNQTGARATKRALEKNIKKEAAKVKRDRQTERIARSGVTDAATWRQSRRPVLVELPSGNICKAINKGFDAMLKGGRIPNSLMPIINAALLEGENRKAADTAKTLLESPDQLAAAISFANTCVVECVVEPKILPVPKRLKDPDETTGDDEVYEEIPIEEREEPLHGELWVDETSLDDRLFIMNWVLGGTQDIERFRQEQAAIVDDVHAGEGAGAEAE